jgi:hypothetical protein
MADKKNNESNKSSKKEPVKTEKIDLGLLEEDDEFEEFPAEGKSRLDGD